MNQSLPLRRLLTHRLFQAALLGIPAAALLFTACSESTGSTSSTSSTSGAGGAGGADGTGGSSTYSSGTVCPPSWSSGTGTIVDIANPCFPWPSPGTTGAGGTGSASGTGGSNSGSTSGTSGSGGGGGGGGGGSMALPCPEPKMAPPSWNLDEQTDPSLIIQGPIGVQPSNGECCYLISKFCPP